MNAIDIQINTAKISSVNIDFGEEEMHITATIDLLAGSKKITSFQASTKRYYGSQHFSLPPVVVQPAMKVGKILEDVVINLCNKSLAQLPEPENEIKVDVDKVVD